MMQICDKLAHSIEFISITYIILLYITARLKAMSRAM